MELVARKSDILQSSPKQIQNFSLLSSQTRTKAVTHTVTHAHPYHTHPFVFSKNQTNLKCEVYPRETMLMVSVLRIPHGADCDRKKR